MKSGYCLADAAVKYPHSAHTVLTKSLQHEWGYILRVVSESENFLHPLKDALFDLFIPQLTDMNLSIDEKELMSKPVRHIGLGIEDPVFNASLAYSISFQSTKMLTDAIRNNDTVDLEMYENDIKDKK